MECWGVGFEILLWWLIIGVSFRWGWPLLLSFYFYLLSLALNGLIFVFYKSDKNLFSVIVVMRLTGKVLTTKTL
jgi:hypothetical protein